MPSPLWDLFVQRVTATNGRPTPAEMGRLAEALATRLAVLNTLDAADALSSFAELVAERYERIKSADPSGAPVPMSIPTPPEVVAAILRDFNEAEVLEEMREMENGGGRKLEDFLPELLQAGGPPPV